MDTELENLDFKSKSKEEKLKKLHTQGSGLITNTGHSFKETYFAQPTWCGFCRQFLWGIASKQGVKCEYCGYVAHFHCQSSVLPTCRTSSGSNLRVTLGANSSVEEVNDENAEGDLMEMSEIIRGVHHFVAAHNLGLKNCMVCNVSLINPVGVDKCSVCLKYVHSTCLKKFEALPPCIRTFEKILYYPNDKNSDGTPLVCFVSSKAGGNQGVQVLAHLRRHLFQNQIFDLFESPPYGPAKGLEIFRNVPNFRILACGGDGTVGWILSELDKEGFPNGATPPIAILPLGTGNDLSRVLGWGPGYDGEKIKDILEFVQNESEEVNLDRWSVVYYPVAESEQPKNWVMNNYFSVGTDAQVALRFHEARETNPDLFFSRSGNKGWYAGFAVEKLISTLVPFNSTGSCVLISGNPVTISDKTEGIIVTNIPSYAGGTNLWGTKHKFSESKYDDGKLEIMGVTGIAHMTGIAAGVSSPERIGQAELITIELKQPIAYQIDGEPGMLQPGKIIISHHNTVRMLKRVVPVSEGLLDSLMRKNNSAVAKTALKQIEGDSFPELIDVTQPDDN